MGVASYNEKYVGEFVASVYPLCQELAQESMERIRSIIHSREPDITKWIALFDGAWLYRGYMSPHGSAVLVDYETGAIPFGGHRSIYKSAFDRVPHVGSSGSIEVSILEELLEEVARLQWGFDVMVADADAKIQALVDRFGIDLARCINHVCKNCGKHGIAIGKLKHCECDPKLKQDGTTYKNGVKEHDKITIDLAKKAQCAVGAITRSLPTHTCWSVDESFWSQENMCVPGVHLPELPLHTLRIQKELTYEEQLALWEGRVLQVVRHLHGDHFTYSETMRLETMDEMNAVRDGDDWEADEEWVSIEKIHCCEFHPLSAQYEVVEDDKDGDYALSFSDPGPGRRISASALRACATARQRTDGDRKWDGFHATNSKNSVETKPSEIWSREVLDVTDQELNAGQAEEGLEDDEEEEEEEVEIQDEGGEAPAEKGGELDPDAAPKATAQWRVWTVHVGEYKSKASFSCGTMLIEWLDYFIDHVIKDKEMIFTKKYGGLTTNRVESVWKQWLKFRKKDVRISGDLYVLMSNLAIAYTNQVEIMCHDVDYSWQREFFNKFNVPIQPAMVRTLFTFLFL